MVDPGSLVWALVSSSEGGNNALMSIDPGVIIWTLIIFAILLVVLKKVAWKPILEAVRNREERIRQSLAKAEEVEANAEKTLAEQKELMTNQRQEMSEALKRAKDEAKKAGQEALEKARGEAAELTERARRQIDEERKKAIEEIRTQAIDLAIVAASHLLKKSLDQESHRKIVTEYLEQLPDSVQKH